MTDEPHETGFFATGGTLPFHAPSYVERQADAELLRGLVAGEFCYLLTSRQMGKSSLMVRTAAHLRARQIEAIVLDLSRIGNLVGPEQWYYSLASQIAQRLGAQKELRTFWQKTEEASPLQKWVALIEQYLLRQPDVRLVVFIDEIDQVRALNFATDEFFAAIRACYNRRSEDTHFSRLSFCLLGVAAPSDLIRDSRLTPFNIGRRIELTDFTGHQADVLLPGLNREEILAEALLERVLSWTGGHPYLTQRLCQEVAEGHQGLTPAEVDRLCADLFFTAAARTNETNLSFVRDRLLKSEAGAGPVLEMYRDILRGKLVRDIETDERVSALRLAGIVRSENGFLKVRNRVYAGVFDRRWIGDNMPEAEARQLRRAYRQGVFRTSVAACMLLALLGSIAFIAVQEVNRTKTHSALLEQSRQFNYAADLMIIQRELETGNYGRVAELLNAKRPKNGEQDQRGWEWGYYWSLMHQDRHTFLHNGKGIVFSVAVSPDGQSVASAHGDGSIRLWNLPTLEEILPGLCGPTGRAVLSLAFCPTDGRLLASGGADKTVRLWDLNSRKTSIIRYSGEVLSLALSPDGRYLATGCNDGTLSVRELTLSASNLPIYQRTYEDHYTRGTTTPDPVNSVTFSPNGRWLAVGLGTGKIVLLPAPFAHEFDFSISASRNQVHAATFSPDNTTLAIGRENGDTELWDVAAKTRIVRLLGHAGLVAAVVYSRDGRYLATGSWDDTVRLWDVVKKKAVHTFVGHSDRITCVAFSRDGKTLISSAGKEIKIWDAQDRAENPRKLPQVGKVEQERVALGLLFGSQGAISQLVIDHGTHELTLSDLQTRSEVSHWWPPADVESAVLSTDGQTVALGHSGGTVTLHSNTPVLQEKARIDGSLTSPPEGRRGAQRLAFSYDGKMLAVVTGEPARVTVWDLRSGPKKIGGFQHSNSSEGVAFSRDGKTLAIATWPGMVYLWDIAAHQGEVQASDLVGWRAHSSSVMDVAFSEDGKTLATASEDKTVKLWNVATQREMITLRDQKQPVRRVEFSPDGRYLASTGWDGTVRVYRARLPSEPGANGSLKSERVKVR